MGMTIEESIDYLSNENTKLNLSTSDKDAIDRIISAYLITKANYNEQLKADMVAMLTELYMEIEELDTPSDDSYDTCVVDCEKLIQQKIDKLKGQTDGNK